MVQFVFDCFLVLDSLHFNLLNGFVEDLYFLVCLEAVGDCFELLFDPFPGVFKIFRLILETLHLLFVVVECLSNHVRFFIEPTDKSFEVDIVVVLLLDEIGELEVLFGAEIRVFLVLNNFIFVDLFHVLILFS